VILLPGAACLTLFLVNSAGAGRKAERRGVLQTEPVAVGLGQRTLEQTLARNLSQMESCTLERQFSCVRFAPQLLAAPSPAQLSLPWGLCSAADHLSQGVDMPVLLPGHIARNGDLLTRCSYYPSSASARQHRCLVSCKNTLGLSVWVI